MRWKGLLEQSNGMVRLIAIAVLVIGSVSLTFTQLGFVSIGPYGSSQAYLVILLQPIALSALLLGPLNAFLIGLFVGATLLFHSHVMPLDFYELTFVTPTTSIVMLSLAGLLLGFLFAFALRKNPPLIKSIIYITIICVAVSWLYSQGFLVSMIVNVISHLSSIFPPDASENEVANAAIIQTSTSVMRLGDVGLQAWIDALLMAVFCNIVNILVPRIQQKKSHYTVRVLFNAWLSIAVLLVFMVTETISFGLISQAEWAEAKDLANSEVTYLIKHLKVHEERKETALDVLSNHADLITDESVDDFVHLLLTLDDENLLDGYTKEDDGIIFIYDNKHENTVLYSDYNKIDPNHSMDVFLSEDNINALHKSLNKGTFESIVYDNRRTVRFDDEGNIAEVVFDGSTIIHSELAYLLARSVDDYTVVMIMPSNMVYKDRALAMAQSTLSILALLAVIYYLTSKLLGLIIIRRINETNDALKRITDGDLDVKVEVHNTQEFDSLSEGINNTVAALKGWISEAETRMDNELATAKTIQESALPRIFPPYPDILRFDIYASMDPAREVGGDFYDFFLIGDNSNANSGKLAFLIADVSGKGVPAALFMMKAKALIRGYMEGGMEIGEAIENSNHQLCEGNNTGMFVTVFAGILDYGTWDVVFVNAGHNPPLLWQEGSWHWVKEKSGLPLGLFDGMPYKTHSISCKIGDQFLLYTDGVTEAMSVQEKLYGEARLEELVQKNYPLHPRELTETIRDDVALHAEGAVQSDDITILALEVGVPPEITATITVPALVSELPRVNTFIHTELDKRLCPLRAQNQLDIAVEELFVNVAHYAYPNATQLDPGEVRVSYTYSAEPPSITIDIIDDGIAFNPLEKSDVTTADDIQNVSIGGLGIMMAKRSVDKMSYERIDGSNIVTIVKKW